jgi:hypothetical protein
LEQIGQPSDVHRDAPHLIAVSSRPNVQQLGSGLKRSGQKRNRAEVEHSTYGDGNKDSETKLEQSFA